MQKLTLFIVALMMMLSLSAIRFTCGTPSSTAVVMPDAIEGESLSVSIHPSVSQSVHRINKLIDVSGPFCYVRCSNSMWSVKITNEDQEKCAKISKEGPCPCESLGETKVDFRYMQLSGTISASKLKKICQME